VRLPSGFASGFLSRLSSGFSRKITRTLPICCTACASSRAQIVAIHVPRASRSSLAARTLMSSCALSARSISAMTGSVRPLSPTMTTGLSLWAWDRNSLRRDGESGIDEV
jgi:hypothetical protein